jgi:hypothetical protein
MQPYDPARGDMVEQANHPEKGTPGELIRVRTDLGTRVAAWRPTNIPNPAPNPQPYYFCHGFSLGTFARFGYSVMSGPSMHRVLADEYRKIGTLGMTHEGMSADGRVLAGDLLVWWKDKDPVHSAIVEEPVMIISVGPVMQRRLNPERTLVSSKTGTGIVRRRVPLTVVKADYEKHSYAIEVYRRA